LEHDGQLADFGRIIAQPENALIERWKGSGRPVIGYFCSYVPVELITAVGAMPFRLRGAGSVDSSAADTFLSSRTCTYVRHTLSLALEGRYHFLDGEISLNTCDHVRRAYDLWRHKTNIGFHGFLSVPRNARESLYPYFREEIENLKSALEKYLAKPIEDAGLRKAIALHNAVRDRLRRINEWRLRPKPVLSGASMLTIAIAAQVMPPSDFIEKADRYLATLESERPEGHEPRARMLLVGGELDEPDFVAALESQGATVVADTLCVGMKTFDRPVEEGSSLPLDALGRRYFFHTPCARMIGNFPERADAIIESMRRHAIDGIVFQRLKFCDPWGGEAHNLRERLKKQGIPVLFLEREYGLLHAGQVKTRVQAFLEMMESSYRRGSKTGDVEPRESGARAPRQTGEVDK
jgi:benzoyl-CoA reductase/2-hydroxyglutaryl-CoA dehydratase subunit BcrC/BadD/HgdB